MTSLCHPIVKIFSILTLCSCGLGAVANPITIRERFTQGNLYSVSVRVRLDGTLTLPPQKGQTQGKQLKITGQSKIDYAERLLTIDPRGQVTKTIRMYKTMDFRRQVADGMQQSHLRPQVRRLVVLRHKQIEVPFSPDGPLTWGEIDLVRTDVFTPALVGLFPKTAVRIGDTWQAHTSAARELTDFERIDKNTLVCRLEKISKWGQHKHALVSFRGAVTGINEDGRGQQHLNGYYYFNLETNHLSYVTMNGNHLMLDPSGKTVGSVKGQFTLTRTPLRSANGLNPADLNRLTLKPNPQNTQLLYDNPQSGLRFLYPRRWRVAGRHNTQIGLDEKGGSGILLTLEPLKRLPTGKQFLQESQSWLRKQKATITKVWPVQSVQTRPHFIEAFALDVKVGKNPFRMYYFIVRQAQGGVVVAARLLHRDLVNLQREVLGVARSVRVTKKQ